MKRLEIKSLQTSNFKPKSLRHKDLGEVNKQVARKTFPILTFLK